MTHAPPLLDVRNLVVHFPLDADWLGRRKRAIRAVDGVTFQLAAGETLGLVGESGSGKSTIARAILRLVPITSGKVLFEGLDLATLSPAELRRVRRRLQVVFQDPVGSLNPRMTAGDIIAEPLHAHAILPRRSRSARVAELLERVGLRPEHAGRFPHQFSGGQRQRIGIARALAVNPSLLICDEPVSALDVSVQSQIVNLLADLREQQGLACLFIAHSLAVVRQLCDRVAVLYLGRIVEIGPAGDVLIHPRHPYTRALLSAVPGLSPRSSSTPVPILGEPPSPLSPPSGCDFHTRCPHAEATCRQEPPALRALPASRLGSLVACHRAEDLEFPDATPKRDPSASP